MPSPVIRAATPGDAPAIAAIHAASWQAAYRWMLPDADLDGLTPTSRLPMWEEILSGRHPGIAVWVADIGHEMVGFASTNPSRDEPDSGELATIYLHPGWMGQGIGGLLLARAEAGLADQGFLLARLAVLRDNLPARRFYERAGWTTDGEEAHDEVHGVRVVDVVYRKALAPPSTEAS